MNFDKSTRRPQSARTCRPSSTFDTPRSMPDNQLIQFSPRRSQIRKNRTKRCKREVVTNALPPKDPSRKKISRKPVPTVSTTTGKILQLSCLIKDEDDHVVRYPDQVLRELRDNHYILPLPTIFRDDKRASHSPKFRPSPRVNDNSPRCLKLQQQRELQAAKIRAWRKTTSETRRKNATGKECKTSARRLEIQMLREQLQDILHRMIHFTDTQVNKELECEIAFRHLQRLECGVKETVTAVRSVCEPMNQTSTVITTQEKKFEELTGLCSPNVLGEVTMESKILHQYLAEEPCENQQLEILSPIISCLLRNAGDTACDCSTSKHVK